MDMKTKMFRMTFYAFAALLVACTNVEGTYDAVYITEAQSAVEMTLSVDPDLIVEEPATVSLTISTSVKADADVQVGLKLSPELVDSYNSKNSTEYQFAPEGSFELSSFTATVAAGKSMSDAVVLTLKDGSKFETENLELNVKEFIDLLSSMSYTHSESTMVEHSSKEGIIHEIEDWWLSSDEEKDKLIHKIKESKADHLAMIQISYDDGLIKKIFKLLVDTKNIKVIYGDEEI